MPKQPALPRLSHTMKKKVTRREAFLSEMDAVVPWTRLLALIEPHYPKAGPQGGRPPMPLEVMLRVHFLQQWYALSDPMAEESLYDSEAMRHFAGIELGDDRIPDETTILDFRHLLERHGLTEALFAAVNAHLADKGITLRAGTPVDGEGASAMGSSEPPNSIDAPSSTKNKAGARDPEMSSTRKGNDWYFGMKAHVGVDADSGVTPKACPWHDVHSLQTTTAKTHDARVWDDLLHGTETSVWAELPFERHWSERQWRRLCQRGAGGRVRGPRQGLGGDEEGAEGRPARSDRSGHQPAHRQGAGTGRTSLSRDQAPVRVSEDPLPRAGEEPGATLHAVHPRQPVSRPTTAAGMRRSPSEIGPAAGQAVKTANKTMDAGRPPPQTAFKPNRRRSRTPCSDVPWKKWSSYAISY
jgi:IS5 family transposase